MKALLLEAEFKPRPGYRLTERERLTKRANDGTQVFWNPRLRMIDMAVPAPAPGQVLVKVKATGVEGRFDRAAVIFEQMSTQQSFPEFLTLPLYEEI